MGIEKYDYRLPRLFVTDDLVQGEITTLGEENTHYLKNVLRRKDQSEIRVFNGRDGEFLAKLDFSDRKIARIKIGQNIRAQKQRLSDIHLVFALIKKDRMDFMIEKAVELGVTHFHPVVTRQTVIRDLNLSRLERQICEAAEQCERLDQPALNPLLKIEELLKDWPDHIPLYAAIERVDAPYIAAIALEAGPHALLIGPEGGFSDEEKDFLSHNEKIKSVNLGPQILRAETAALFGLSVIIANAEKSA